MKTMLTIAAISGAIAFAGHVLAQENAPADPAEDPILRMNTAANTYAIESASRLLEPGDVLRLLVVVQQKALAANCDGFEVDHERYRTVMNSIMGELQELTEPEQNNLPVDVVMHALGIATGGQLAVAAYDQDAYCARGEVVKAELAEDSEGRLTVLVME